MHKTLTFFILLSLDLFSADFGALLFQGNCVTCHFENTTVSAPSMHLVRASYLKAHPDKKDFVDSMAYWVKKPKKQSALMPEAIKKHDLMPELGYDMETLKSISSYIYDTDFTQKHKQ